MCIYIYVCVYIFMYIYLEKKKKDFVLPKKKKKTSLEEWDDWEKEWLTKHVEKLLKMFLSFTFY